MDALERLLDWGGTRRDIVFLVISGLALVVSGFDLMPWLPYDAAWAAIILCGLPIVFEAVHGLVTAFDIKADVLVSMALIASVIVGEDFAAGEVACIMQLGALLEDLTVARARAGIEKLVHLTPRTARVLDGDAESIIPSEAVRVDDLLRVLPGETIPVDGEVVRGHTAINQAVMTGESLPVDKGPGDTVFSGTVNQYGSFDMRAVKVGEDSSLQRMIRLVQSADAGKAKIVGLADRWATWVVVFALAAALCTYVATGEILRSVTILVVFCPCALVLATPTAIMAAIGNATRHRFLVREGDALERLADVDRVCFDKTGTLTVGRPSVVEVKSLNPAFSGEDVFRLAACAEQRSEHPLGRAIVDDWKAKHGPLPWTCEDFAMQPGRGVSAVVNGRTIHAGGLEMVRAVHSDLGDEGQAVCERVLGRGDTLVCLVVDGAVAGLITLADTLRTDVRGTIDDLKRAGVTPVLLTGDHEAAARTIAAAAGITEVRAECLPEDKLSYIDKSERSMYPVCMIGDGINDAPALRRARVGIAMGRIGSDIAIDAADIVLVDDDIRRLGHVFRLAKRTMRVIKANLSFSMLLNFAAIILAITAVLNPVTGALVHNMGSVFVIINSIFLLNWESPEAKTLKLRQHQSDQGASPNLSTAA